MRSVFKWAVLFSLLFFSAGTAFSYWVLRSGIKGRDFIPFAEQKAGELFGADVRIGKIKVGLLNQVALSGLSIQQKSDSPFGLEVGQIVFRYQLSNLFSRDLKSPATIHLRSPKFVLYQNSFPYDFFDRLKSSTASALLSNLKLEEGEARFYIEGIPDPIKITGIKGGFLPEKDGKVSVDIRAAISGFVSVKLHIHGEIDLRKRSHQLFLKLESVKIGHQKLPKKAISGVMRWENKSFYLDNLRFKVKGWDSVIKGSLMNMGEIPTFSLSGYAGKEAERIEVRLKGDMGPEDMSGTIHLPNGEQDFKAKIKHEAAVLSFENILFEDGTSGRISLNLQTGDLLADFLKQNRHVVAKLHFRDRKADIYLLLNHVPVLGLDCVAGLNIQLVPLVMPDQKRDWKFLATFETEYFILEYSPFEDLKGSMKITSRGIRNFEASWGGVFRSEGKLMWPGGKPELEADLVIKRLDLQKINPNWAAKSFPKTLRGRMDGKIRFRGDPKLPEVSAKLTIKSGKIGKLDYDRAFIEFRGYAPYLSLSDSRILKGRTTLHLKGGLDLSVKNVFHGVEIQTAEKFTVWKGFDMTREDGGFGMASDFWKLSGITLKSDSSVDASDETKGKAKDNFIGLGPKFKF